ncbi:MAG TPA: hypothetical protein VGI74_01015 [Streptosporangiaceae bacterium]
MCFVSRLRRSLQFSHQFVIEQGDVAGLEVYSHDLSIDHPELVESGLYQLPPYLRLSMFVGQGAVAAHQQRMIQCCLDGLIVLLVLPDEGPSLP